MSDLETGRAPARIRRIIVDCSHIAPHHAHTGIPRVVMRYVELGAEVAQRHGVSMVCAQYMHGSYRRRSVDALTTPGAGLRERPSFGLKLALEAGRYGSRVLRHGAGLMAALVPARPVRRAAEAVAHWSDDLVPALRRRAAARRPAGEALRLGPGDILFCPGYWHEMDAQVYRDAREQGADVVFVIHDILPVTLPTHYQYPWRREFDERLSASFGLVSQYYCISRQTLAEVATHAGWQGREVRASVAYNGFDPQPAPTGTDGPRGEVGAVLDRAPWLMVGTLEPKKGHADAIAAFTQLWERGYQRPLLLLGRHGWMSEPIVDAIKTSPWLGQRLFWFEGVDDATVAAAYRRAHALLFASQAEGFGLPLLEAVAHGTPVLVRDMPVSREVMGPGDFYFSDRRTLMGAIQALEAPERRAALVTRQGELEWYRWPDVVEATILDLLRRPGTRRVGMDLLGDVPRARIRPSQGTDREVRAEVVRATEDCSKVVPLRRP
ncbi:glycosyltransferase family 4 protein [Aquabacter cavernae]|uniref:glycosyltransferase family 4 protein n=1 Tax=Aquabacter cavernae TaxID=2496029 RepID=UPI000F8E1CE2|nr:glycosyltransferase family 1 protein [Aquabacter cavernae]